MDQAHLQPDTPLNSTPKPESPQPPQETPPVKSGAVQEVHHYHHDKKGGFSLARLLFGGILILIGIAYLGNSFGWFSVNVDFWQLWPILIVFLGLSILSRHGWVAWVVGSLVTLIVLGGVAYAIFVGFPVRDLSSETISVDRSTEVSEAKINIATGAGELTLRGGSDKLADGTFTSNVTTLTKSETIRETVQELDLEMRGQWRGFGSTRNELSLNLTKDLPIDLSIDSGAMDMELDLAEVVVKRLSIDTGASSLDLVLGDRADQSDILVKAGASAVTIAVPRSAGVRLTIDAGLTSKTFEDFTRVDENVYESDGYAEAAKKIDIELDLGVSSLTVNWR